MTVPVLTVPGINGSGPDHWQSYWEAMRPDCVRVEQQRWHDPDPDSWTAALEAAVVAAPNGVLIAAHSLGCATMAHWAAAGGSVERIGGALLVAPCDVERTGAPEAIRRFAPMPVRALPFPSTVVASANDPYAALPRARCFAHAWGSALIEAGPLGHINAASLLGDWPLGQALLDALAVQAERAGAYRRAAVLRNGSPRPAPCFGV